MFKNFHHLFKTRLDFVKSKNYIDSVLFWYYLQKNYEPHFI